MNHNLGFYNQYINNSNSYLQQFTVKKIIINNNYKFNHNINNNIIYSLHKNNIYINNIKSNYKNLKEFEKKKKN